MDHIKSYTRADIRKNSEFKTDDELDIYDVKVRDPQSTPLKEFQDASIVMFLGNDGVARVWKNRFGRHLGTSIDFKTIITVKHNYS
jgi:hypothetical protein